PENPSMPAISFRGRWPCSTELVTMSLRTASRIEEYDCPSVARRRLIVLRSTPRCFATLSAEQLPDLSITHMSSRTVSLTSERAEGRIESKYSFKYRAMAALDEGIDFSRSAALQTIPS